MYFLLNYKCIIEGGLKKKHSILYYWFVFNDLKIEF